MTTLIPKYDEGSAGAVNRPINLKLAEFVSVLDFGADDTGVADSTAAFNAAIATGNKVYVPAGTYSVANITVVNGMVIQGAGRAQTYIQVNTNSAGAFYANALNFDIRLSDLNITAKGGITNAKAWKQLDGSFYTAYPIFENIETRVDLEVSYQGFFIFARWLNCRDGYEGNAVGGQTHQAITSIPDAYGQGEQTNINQIIGCQFFRSSATAIDMQYGNSLLIQGCDFESLTATAASFTGLSLVKFQNCWFEGVVTANIVSATLSPAPNSQGSRGISFDSCFALCNATNQYFFYAGGAVSAGITNTVFATTPVAMQLTNLSNLIDYYNVFQASGSATNFFNGVVTQRGSTFELITGAINSPEAQNTNILPIGPTNVLAASFTNSGLTSITDTASVLTSGNTLLITADGDGGCCYYTMPAKLVTFLQGKTITICASGYGSGGGSDGLACAVWDSVATPTHANTSKTGTAILTSSTALQTSYVNYTVTAGCTSLKVGFDIGGNSGGRTVAIETMQLVVGTTKPLIAGLH